MPGGPGAHVLETVDFHRVIVGSGGDLADGIEGGVGDAEAALVFPYACRSASVAFAAHLPEIPDTEIAV